MREGESNLPLMYMIDRQTVYIMNLADFHSLVRLSLKRGTTLDAVIPSYTKMAAAWLERNYTFKYMEVFRLLQLIAGDRTIEVPSNKLIKDFDFIRVINETGEYSRLAKIDPKELARTETGTPTAFFVVGRGTIVFDNTPDANFSGEALFHEYSDWPTADNAEHPLFDMAPDVLLHQTLLFMAAYLRDAEMAAAYKVLRDEAVNTLTRAEDETKYGGETLSMAYIPHGFE